MIGSIFIMFIDTAASSRYTIFNALNLAGGFDSSFRTGTKALCRAWYMAFFMPSCFMMGGVVGSRKACRSSSRSVNPLHHPSPVCLTASVGGFKSQNWCYL